uniref:NADH-ubiquinone oxidoreductase chain 4L n=1 Tax=Vischeria cf. polyphem TaxID=1132302 RepID=A0A5J6Y328_9STRA|nr:NADH dehydrogenase subunit 4L [Eustigmatos cf. polyphem]
MNKHIAVREHLLFKEKLIEGLLVCRKFFKAHREYSWNIFEVPFDINIKTVEISVIFSLILGDIIGQIFALMVLCVAAAESAIGLAILVIYYRSKGNILIEQSHLMRG